jgi:hypothetical protein
MGILSYFILSLKMVSFFYRKKLRMTVGILNVEGEYVGLKCWMSAFIIVKKFQSKLKQSVEHNSI